VALATYLVDKSAYARLRQPVVAAAMRQFADGLATCSTVALEMGWSATNAADFEETRRRMSSYTVLDTNQHTLDLAVDIQAALVRRGHHRGPGVADLLLAATAITHSAIVLHYDRDFELIGEVDERLQHQWIVPRGSIA
jgi:predicted nucleic acid-binding protein